MSNNPSDFIDPYFWDWYRDKGPSWLIDCRLDILATMYEAYEDSLPNRDIVTMIPGKPFFFMGDSDEFEEFVDILNKVIEPFRKNIDKSQIPITNIEIMVLKKKMNNIKFRRKRNEGDQSKDRRK